MRKIVKIIVALLIIVCTCMISISSFVNAAQPTISVTSNIVQGSKYTVTVNIPSEAIGYQGVIKVTYSDNSTDSSGMLAVLDTNLQQHPGNMTATFTARVVGSATVTVEQCKISDKSGNHLGTPSALTFNISEKPAETPPANNTPAPTTNTSSGGSAPATNNVSFTDVNEKVFTTERVNVRASYSTSSSILGKANKGTALTRTGVGNNGWSRVVYGGNTAYIKSEYLTTTDPNASSTTTNTINNTVSNNVTNNTTNTVTNTSFKDVNDTMYAIQGCNVRKGPSTNTDKIGGLEKGQSVARTGTSDDGWSRIKFKDGIGYVATRLLSSDKPDIKETEVNDTMYANKKCNVRKGPSTDTDIVGSLEKGDEVTIIGVLENGWGKLEYKGENAYVLLSLLSAKETTDSNEVTNETSNTLTDEEKLAIIKEEVGVLPEVGINPAVIIYIVISAIAIISACAIIYKKENS